MLNIQDDFYRLLNNLAANSDYNDIKNELAKWLPTDNVEQIGKLEREKELKRIIRQKIIGVKPDSRNKSNEN